MSHEKSVSAGQKRHGSESVADRARDMATQIEGLPDAVVKSFAGGRSMYDRVAMLRSATNKISIGMFSVISWVERRAHPDTARLFRNRLDLVLSEAQACVHYDIPEYATGTPQQVFDEPSDGAGRTATLVVTTRLVAGFLRDWAMDIEAEQRKGDQKGRARRRWTQAEVDEAIREYAKSVQRKLAALRRAVAKGKPDAIKRAREVFGRNTLAKKLRCSGAMVSKSKPWRAIAGGLRLTGRKPGTGRGERVGVDIAVEQESEAEWKRLAAEQAEDSAADEKPRRRRGRQ